MTEVAHYSFVPWLRRGLAAGIAAPDTLGDAPGDGGGRAQLSAELALTQVPLTDGTAPAPAAIRKSIELLGPGDVGAIAPQAIVRTEPYAGAADATPGELAYVEFYEEDFPWRYTPARAANQVEDPARRHKLRPWIALWVLEEDEFELLERAGAPPVLALRPGADLPPAGETWAWAHVQLSQAVADPAQVGSAIQARPDHALSRLLCPRRLEAGRHYHAVLVPAFETGRLAGLGLPTAGVPTQQASWGTAAAQADPRYPVYLHWSFSTGFLGSFEELVRALVARPVGEAFGKRPLDVRDPGYGLDRGGGPDTVGLEGALQPPRFVRDPFPDVPGPAFVAGLEEVVDLSENLTTPGSEVPDDPIVTPPAYGRWHAGLARVADAADDPDAAWLRELNLDPRARAAAGLGTEVVRQRQEELMERAWKQVGRLEDANQRLREAELATAAGDALYAKHLLTATAERTLILTSAAQTGLGAAGRRITVRGAVDESRVPAAAQSAAFRRLTRPQRKLLRQVTGRADVGGLQDGLISGMNADPAEAITTAPPPPEPPAAVSLAAVKVAAANAVTEFQEDLQPWQVLLELLHADLAARRARTPPEDLATLTVPALQAALRAALAARAGSLTAALATAVGLLIEATQTIAPDGSDAVTVTLPPADFAREFGPMPGKTYRGVTVRPGVGGPAGEAVRATGLADVQQFGADLGGFETGVVAARPTPPPPPTLPQSDIAATVREGLRPARELHRRVTAALPGLDDSLAARPPGTPRPLRPVLAHPTFPDPMVEPLSAMSIDFVLPNAVDLPSDTITLMEPNARFIESYLAGLNHELARELLWREYPTDLRGSYFRTFWDGRDALGEPPRSDVKALERWQGELGDQSERATGTLVLVVKGALLRKYPNVIVYAQEAEWPDGDTSRPRRPAPDGQVLHPTFSGTLAPGVAIWGFQLSEDTARGHRRTDPVDPTPERPGFFFVLKERPGQVRFGLDDETPETGRRTWDDLAWDAITFPDGTSHLRLAANALTTTDPQDAAWARTSADMAAILFQSPVLYARHAEELLPP